MSKRGGQFSQQNGCSAQKKSMHEQVASLRQPEFPFKKQNFQHSAVAKPGKKKNWKGLKQIAQNERVQADFDAPTYLSIDSPPSLKPPKKYSDISGHLALYTDPETGLHYATCDEYKLIKRLPSDAIQGYLSIRNASRT